MSITFPVSEVESSATRLAPRDVASQLTAMLPDARVEQWDADGPLVSCDETHALVVAAWKAFDHHHPLRLSPDAVWFTVAQGLARAVSLDPEGLRSRLVRHAGKLTLSIERPDFALGRPNLWPEALGQLSDAIASHVGKLRDLVRGEFTTTGPMERVAFDVLAMDVFQSYFEYEIRCGCGIPSITLTGTAEDWRSVRRRAAVLAEFDLAWWIDELLPILDHFVRAAEGAPDALFWQSMVRYRSGSLGNELTGWIHVLIPFLFDQSRALVRNPYLVSWLARFEAVSPRGPRSPANGPHINRVPGALAVAPLRLVMPGGAIVPARVTAGLLGVRQHEDGTLEPGFGWAVLLTDPAYAIRHDKYSPHPVLRAVRSATLGVPLDDWLALEADRREEAQRALYTRAAAIEDPVRRASAVVAAASIDVLTAIPTGASTPLEEHWWRCSLDLKTTAPVPAVLDLARVRRAAEAVLSLLDSRELSQNELPPQLVLAVAIAAPERLPASVRGRNTAMLRGLVLVGKADDAWARYVSWREEGTRPIDDAPRDLLDDIMLAEDRADGYTTAMTVATVSLARGDRSAAEQALSRFGGGERYEADLPEVSLAGLQGLRALAGQGGAEAVSAFVRRVLGCSRPPPLFVALREELDASNPIG